MTKIYKYTGDVEVEVSGAGIFQPGEEKEVEIEIDNPLFEEVKKGNQTRDWPKTKKTEEEIEE